MPKKELSTRKTTFFQAEISYEREEVLKTKIVQHFRIFLNFLLLRIVLYRIVPKKPKGDPLVSPLLLQSLKVIQFSAKLPRTPASQTINKVPESKVFYICKLLLKVQQFYNARLFLKR